MSSDIYDGILNIYNNNDLLYNNDISLKISGKGFINSSNISNIYDYNGIGYQLFNNSLNNKEINIINSSNLYNSNFSILNFGINNNNINIKSFNIKNFNIKDINNIYILKYPPKAFNSSTSETTITLFNKTVYYQTFILNTDNINYGIGTYEIYSSSTYSNYSKELLFNFQYNESAGTHWAAYQYDNNGNYSGTNYISNDINYKGDWIIIKLPEYISLSGFSFIGRNGFLNRAPGLWRCYGSSNGIDFYKIEEASNETINIGTEAYIGTNLIYKKLLSLKTPEYNYIGFTINKLAGSETLLNFNEIEIYGYILTNFNIINFNDNININNNYFSLRNSNINNNINITGNINLNSNLIFNNFELLPSLSNNFKLLKINNANIDINTSNFIANNIIINGNIYNNNSLFIPNNIYSFINSQWSNIINSSNIYYNNGFIGLGITTPVSSFHISSSISSNELILLFENNINSNLILKKDIFQNGILINYDSSNLYIGTSNTERIKILNNGNIGIGTFNPNYTLHINGIISSSELLINNNNISNIIDNKIKITSNILIDYNNFTNKIDFSIFSTFSAISNKENILTFNNPLKKNSNIITLSIDNNTLNSNNGILKLNNPEKWFITPSNSNNIYLNQNIYQYPPTIWYNFDDYNNFTLDYISGSNLTNQNNIQPSSTKVARGTYSVYLNGTNQYFTINNGVNLNNKSFSISFWLNKDDTTTNQYIFSRNATTNYSTRNSIAIGFRNTTGFTFSLYGDDLDITIDLANEHQNKWVFWTIIFNNLTKVGNIYFNGILRGTKTFGGSYIGYDNNIQIGRVYGDTYYYKGYIDDFRIYLDYVLSENEILNIYNNIGNIDSKDNFYNLSKIGINTSNPTSALTINGDIKLSCNILNNDGTTFNNNIINDIINNSNFYFNYLENSNLNISNINILTNNFIVPTLSPINNSINLTNNFSYLQINNNTNIIFNNNILVDILLVGAGGNGGFGPFSGGGGAGEIIFYPNFLFNSGSYDFFIGYNYPKPWAIYTANNYNSTTNQLLDSSGNNYHATCSGSIYKTTGSGNGANAPISYIYGDINTTISFPSGSIPTNFTILSLTRYNGNNKGRILQSQYGNWLHGHWNPYSTYGSQYNSYALRGVVFYEDWKTQASSSVGIQDDWLCCIGKNSGSIPNNILIDGIPVGIVSGGTGGSSYQLGINIGQNEKSDWALSCIYIWDTILTDSEMINLNNIINYYKNTGILFNFNELKNTKIINKENNYTIAKAKNGGNGATINYYISGLGTYTSLNYISNTNDAYISFLSGINYITFTSNIICDILIVGGGGSGGTRCGGGGGAGAVIYLTNQILNSGTYIINIGNGGNLISANTGDGNPGNNGDDTSITYNNNIIYLAKGGGGGGAANINGLKGKSGGSSGGASYSDISNDVLTTNIPIGTYGNKGGTGSSSAPNYSGAGGGGAGSIGGNANGGTTAGNGGSGIQISITGTSIFYGAGGGGGVGKDSGGSILTAGIGGSSIGGNGTNTNTSASAGATNTGSGGGGSGFNSIYNGSSGAGGSGIVIIRIKNINSFYSEATSGGSGGGGGNFITSNFISYYPTIWYNFDDYNNFTNDSISGSNLNNFNNIQPSSLKVARGSYSVYLNGTNQYFTINNGVNLNNKSFSISFWLNKDNANVQEFIFSRNDTTNFNIRNTIAIGFRSNNTFLFSLYADDLIITIDDINEHQNKWVLWTIIFDNSTKIGYIYFNSILRGFGTFGGSYIGYDNNLQIGRVYGNTNYYKGYIDDFRIYTDYILTDNQINSIYYNINILKYPPKAFNSSTSETTITLFNKTVYYQTFILNTDNINYGSGTYEIYSSSTYSAFTKELLFNFQYGGEYAGSHWTANQYDNNGNYGGTNYISNDINYKGDWIIIKLPEYISLSGFSFIGRNGLLNRAPGLWRCYGSSNGIDYYKIEDASNETTNIGTGAYIGTNLIYKKILSSIVDRYNYIGFTINKLAGSDTILNFNEIEIYGNGNRFLLGSSEGIKNSDNYSLITKGYNVKLNKGGDGGSSLISGSYITNITGTNINIGIGGTGVGSLDIGKNGTNYGDGGSGNGGIGASGTIIFKYSTLPLKTFDINTNIINLNNLNCYYKLIVNNYIGILNKSPNFPLEISSLNINNNFTSQIALLQSSGLSTNTSFNDTNIIIKANGTIWTTNVLISSSDKRIKNNINNINKCIALNKILNIKVKKYNYIDYILQENKIQYGFIAQEIKEIIPEAICIKEDFIPNIYKLGEINDDIIISIQDINNININDNIRLIDKINGDNNCIIIEIISSNKFKINKKLNNTTCLIYGKKINDFYTLNKNYIFTLNISATQELYNLILINKNKIDNIKNKINLIKKYLNI